LGYHEDVDEKESDSWTKLVRDAVKDFVSSVGESSKQLTAAADKFAADSLHSIDEVTRKAQISADLSSDMATAASQAADEARKAADMLHSVVADARHEALTAAQQAAASAREASHHALRVEQLGNGSFVGAGAQQLLERLEADYQLLAKLVQELHSRIATLSGQPARLERPTFTIVGTNPQQSDSESKVMTPEPAPATSPENLGALTGASLATPFAEEMPAPRVQEAPPASPVSEPPPRQSWYQQPAWLEQELEAAPSTPPPPSSLSTWPEEYRAGTYSEAAATVFAEAKPPIEASPILGRILVSIAPVPDFDRLLSLDGALGRMAGVRNVTLADYAKEEVAFRVEVENGMTAQGFGEGLAESSGLRVELVSVSENGLALRLAD